jgi:hypothetical protein
MKHFTRLIVVLLVLVAFTNIASAARPQPEPFVTTGYTANISLIQTPPYVVPWEFRMLPNNYAQFHFVNQGGSAVDDDNLCVSIYGAPCSALCASFGLACGVSGHFTGSFVYDEWGVADQATQSGANHGTMSITTPSGNADLKFTGRFDTTSVNGSFEFLGGTAAYEGIKGGGTKTAVPGVIFSVTHVPCGRQDQPACPADRCAVYGNDLKLKKDTAVWKIANKGEQKLTISRIMVVWTGANPAAIPDLNKVKLDNKTIARDIISTPWTDPMTNAAYRWADITAVSAAAEDEAERQDDGDKAGTIGVDNIKELAFEFKRGDISQNPWDFTILVEFEGGCAVPFVAFPPAQ